MSKKILTHNAILVLIVLLGMGISYTYFIREHHRYESITTFKECVSAGYLVLQTYPETCTMPGKSFSNPLQKKSETNKLSVASSSNKDDFKNLMYLSDGQQVQLRDGTGQLVPMVQGDTTKTFTIVGDPFLQDINNDSIADTIFLLQSNNSRTNKNNFYISAAMSLRSGFTGLNILYLGDDILSGMFTYKNGEVVIGFNTLQATSTILQKYFVLDNLLLQEVIHK